MYFDWGHKLKDASEPVCPHCGYGADGYTATGNPDEIPADNDFCVCAMCASVNQYKVQGKAITVVAISDKKLQAFATIDPELFANLMNAVKAVKQKIIIKL